MGIKDLMKFLRGKCPDVFEEKHLSEFRYGKGAVDISLYIFKYYTIFGPDGWIPAFLNLIACLRRNDIHACFIYDTKSPVEKAGEKMARKQRREKLNARIEELTTALEKVKSTHVIDPILRQLMEKKRPNHGQKSLLLRKEPEKTFHVDEIALEVEKIQKQSVNISQGDFDKTKKIFAMLGVPFFHAPWEAETTCADLCKKGRVDFVISEDSDVLAYGAPLLFTKINTSTDVCTFVRYENVLKKLELDAKEFLDFCIMCGTDYNKNIFRVGPEKSYHLILAHRSIEQIEEKEKLDTSVLNYKRVREIFTAYETFEHAIPFCKVPDFSKLQEYFFVHNIHFNLEKLRDEQVVEFCD